MKYLISLLLIFQTTVAFGAVAPADKAELGITKNYILNSGFERGLAGVSVYRNTAQSTPVTGTGGTPQRLSISASTSAPLRDKASLLITNPGTSTALGDGVSLATVTLDSADKGKVLQFSADYTIVSGTYFGGSSTSDSDLELYFYDVANSQVIQPTPYKVDCAVPLIQCSIRAVMQSAVNSTSYRILLHAASGNTNAWSVKVDNMIFGPQVKTQGYAASDLISAGAHVFTMSSGTVTKGTTSNDIQRYLRLGDHAHVKGEYKQTAAGSQSVANDILIQLPPGLSFDTNKVTFFTGNLNAGQVNIVTQVGLGSATMGNGNSTAVGLVVPYDATRFRIFGVYNSGSSATVGFFGSTFSVSSASQTFAYDFEAPISGWSSNTIGSADAGDSRAIAATASGAPAAVSANAPIIFPSVQQDSHGAYSATTGQYTVPAAGFYDVSFSDAGTSSTSGALVYIYRAGVQYAPIGSTVNNVMWGSGSVYALAGQTIDVRPASAFSAGTASSFSIRRVNTGNQQLTATDTVASQAYMSANTACSATVPCNFDTIDFDKTTSITPSTSAWKFTCPSAGTYSASFVGLGAAGTGNFYIYKNGTQGRFMGYTGGGVGQIGSSPVLVRCITGDYFDLRANASVTISTGSVFSFVRVGNF